MPREKIRPSGFSGLSSLPQLGGRTALTDLTDALDATVDLAAGLTKVAEQKELQDASELLASPLATESEVREITDDALFPLARMAGENRIGSLAAERRLESLHTELEEAPDVLTARAILRDHQARTIEEAGQGNKGIIAGIRERYSEIAAPALTAASERRQAAIKQQSIAAVAEDLTLGLDSGAGSFLIKFVGHYEEELASSGDLDAFHQNVAQTITNDYLRGDDAANNPGSNLNALEDLDAIDNILSSGISLTPKQGAFYSTAREAIERGQEAALKASSTSGAANNKEAHASYARQVVRLRREDPNAIISDELYLGGLKTAATAAQAEAWDELVRGVDEDARTGVANTKIWSDTKRLLKERLVDEDGFPSPEAVAIIGQFESLGISLSSDLAQDEKELQRIATQIANDLDTRGTKLREERKKRTETVMKFNQERFLEAQKLLDSGDIEGSRRLMDETLEASSQLTKDLYQRGLEDLAARNGLNIDRDVVNTLR